MIRVWERALPGKLPALGLSLLLSACAATSPSILHDGQVLEQSGQYEDALRFYKGLLASGEAPADEVNPHVRLVSEALANQKSDQGQRALITRQLEQAIRLAGEAWRLAPELPRVRALLKGVHEAATERANGLVANKKTMEGVRVLDQLLEAWPDDQAGRELRDQLSRDYADGLRAAIKGYDQKGRPGDALLAALALQALHPDDKQSLADANRRRTMLMQSYEVPVTLEVSGRGALPQAVQAALAEVRFTSPFLSRQAGPKTPASLNLTLSKLEENFTQQVEPTTGVKAIPSGTRKVPNPERARLQEDLTRMEARVHSLGDQLDRYQAQISKVRNGADRARLESELSRLEHEHHQLSETYVETSDKLQATPEEVEIVDYRDVRYPVDLYRRAAVLGFRLSALSTRIDLPLRVDLDMGARGEVTDQVHPAYVEYGIPARTLQFEKSDVVLRREALENLAQLVGSTVDSMMHDVLVLELRRGRDMLKDGRMDEAGESFVRVLLGTTEAPGPEIVGLLLDRGVLDPAWVRGTSTPSAHEAEAQRVK